jgi:hypothetical protein
MTRRRKLIRRRTFRKRKYRNRWGGKGEITAQQKLLNFKNSYPDIYKNVSDEITVADFYQFLKDKGSHFPSQINDVEKNTLSKDNTRLMKNINSD